MSIETEKWARMIEIDCELKEAQLAHIRNTEERQERAEAERDYISAHNRHLAEESTPEAKRDWQRHCVAVQAMAAFIIAKGQDPWIDNDMASLVAGSYGIAEVMMKERERLEKEGK
jgi:hypothetical protein